MALQDLYKTYARPLWYKDTNSVGIKQKFGEKEQIFSFGKLTSTNSKKDLISLGDECVRKLNGGMSEGEVKSWAQEQAKWG